MNYFFLILLAINKLFHAKYLEFNYMLKFGSLFLKVSVEDFEPATMAIDQSSQYILFNSDYPTQGEVVGTKTIQIPGRKIEVNVIYENISIEGIQFKSIVYKAKEPIIDNEFVLPISFAYIFSDVKTSVVYQLSSQGLIRKCQFTIDGNFSRRKIYIGGLPEQLISGKDFLTCGVESIGGDWGCRLNYIYFDGIKHEDFKNVFHAKFQTTEYNILVPPYFIEYMKATIFRGLEKKCRYQSNLLFSFFNCDCDIISKLPNINFVFGKKVISIRMVDLFREYDPSETGGVPFCELLMSKNTKTDEFIFGITFLNSFVTKFDYEDSSITFYSDNKFKYYEELKNRFVEDRRIINFFKVIMLLCLLSIILLMYILFKKNNYNL